MMTRKARYAIDDMVGRYRVRALIGIGGMGEVYAAFDPSLERDIALKVIRVDLHADPKALALFHREAKACARLRHPGIVTVHDLGTDGDTPFIAMEHLDGESLLRLVQRGALTLEAKLDILLKVLAALAFAHKHAIVHRDLKPSNLHVLPDGSTKILDFGLARIVSTESILTAPTGTPHYMSPEQIRNIDVDERTDVYAMGVITYELFTGSRPFKGDTMPEIVHNVLNEEIPPLVVADTWLQPSLDTLVRTAMARAATDRYPSAQAMADAIEEIKHAQAAAVAPTVPIRQDSGDAETVVLTVPAGKVAEPAAPSKPASSVLQAIRRPSRAMRRVAVAASAVAFAVLAVMMVMTGGQLSPDVPVSDAPAVQVPAGPPSGPASPEPEVGGPGVAQPDEPPSASGAGPNLILVAPVRPSDVEDVELAAKVSGLLRGEGIDATRFEEPPLAVRVDLSVRPSPFATSTALTGDYSAHIVLTLGGQETRLDYAGQVLEFSELSVRSSALDEAAQRIVEGVLADYRTALTER
ncbi:MAG: hypothetical protein CL471_05065 [Acidobacteria bacterium]|jgi:serine/threonine-protein kinase|nr:hypothetical protein [Acidobacteriota bacterium]